MYLAVELGFDEGCDGAVRGVWEAVREVTGSSLLFDLGVAPHVSLAVYHDHPDAPGEALQSVLDRFVEDQAPLEFQLSSVGTFPGDEGVVFLAPVVTTDLLKLHRRWHERFVAASQPHFLPWNWVPHCTVAMFLGDPALAAALAIVRTAVPLRGRFESIHCERFEPGLTTPVERLASAGFAG